MDIEGWACDGPSCDFETREAAGAHGWYHLATMVSQREGAAPVERPLNGTFHTLACLLDFVETTYEQDEPVNAIASVHALPVRSGPMTPYL